MGRALYDRLLAGARGGDRVRSEQYPQRLQAAFRSFPDDLDTLRREGLAYFSYRIVDPTHTPDQQPFDMDALIARGVVEAHSIVYEDFLPVSAAGIFQSNLGAGEHRCYSAAEEQAAFEEALGAPVADPFELYEALERNSIAAVRAALGGSAGENEAA